MFQNHFELIPLSTIISSSKVVSGPVKTWETFKIIFYMFYDSVMECLKRQYFFKFLPVEVLCKWKARNSKIFFFYLVDGRMKYSCSEKSMLLKNLIKNVTTFEYYIKPHFLSVFSCCTYPYRRKRINIEYYVTLYSKL